MKISVGIITANRLEYLKQALASVLRQDTNVAEVIVVVDGSKDGTIEYLKSLVEPRLQIIIHADTRGRPAARNAAVENMNADALIWLDDDDAFIDGSIAAYQDYLSRHPQAEIVYCDLVNCDSELKPTSAAPIREFPDNEILMRMVFENVISNGGTLIKRHVFERVGLYDHRFPRAQDYHFYMRAAAAGCKFARLPRPQYLVRMHNANLSNPVEVERQSYYQCEVLKDMLALATIEQIFPVLDWGGAAQSSGALVMRLFARVFFDHGDDESALECIEQAEAFLHTPEGAAMKAFILRALNRDCKEQFAQVVAEMMPDLRGMLVTVGAKRGSALIAENYLKRS